MECQAEEMGISDEFYRGVKESDAARTSFLVYRENDIEKEAVRKWFCRFKNTILTCSIIHVQDYYLTLIRNHLNALVNDDPYQYILTLSP